MRVLWFTNIELPAVKKKLGQESRVIGGWMTSLAEMIREKEGIQLGVVACGSAAYNKFTEEGITYFNILSSLDTPFGRFKQLLHRWKHEDSHGNRLSEALRIINEFKPDLIHIHGSENFYGLVAKHTNVPVTISLQGIISSCSYSPFGDFPWFDLPGLLCSREFFFGRGNVHKELLIKNKSDTERQILRNCRNFIGRTEWDKNIVSLLGGRNNHYHHCDEILRSPFYSTQWDPSCFSESSLYATVSGSPRKGLLTLVRALIILKQYGHDQINLRVAGDISDARYRDVIQKHIKNGNISEEITFLGKLKAEEVAHELSCCSVFIHPSYIDNSSNSLAEAMMVGSPCIASAVGGVPSMLEHGMEGFLYGPPGEPYTLAAVIMRILSNKQLAIKMANAARCRAGLRHDPHNIINRMYNIYKTILEEAH